MAITITETKDEGKDKPIEKEVIEKTLQAVTEADKIKKENEELEKQIERNKELKAQIALGGRADAGSVDKTDQEKADEEAKERLSAFQPD